VSISERDGDAENAGCNVAAPQVGWLRNFSLNLTASSGNAPTPSPAPAAPPTSSPAGPWWSGRICLAPTAAAAGPATTAPSPGAVVVLAGDTRADHARLAAALRIGHAAAKAAIDPPCPPASGGAASSPGGVGTGTGDADAVAAAVAALAALGLLSVPASPYPPAYPALSPALYDPDLRCSPAHPGGLPYYASGTGSNFSVRRARAERERERRGRGERGELKAAPEKKPPHHLFFYNTPTQLPVAMAFAVVLASSLGTRMALDCGMDPPPADAAGSAAAEPHKADTKGRPGAAGPGQQAADPLPEVPGRRLPFDVAAVLAAAPALASRRRRPLKTLVTDRRAGTAAQTAANRRAHPGWAVPARLYHAYSGRATI
jgi:hypothetical protein